MKPGVRDKSCNVHKLLVITWMMNFYLQFNTKGETIIGWSGSKTAAPQVNHMSCGPDAMAAIRMPNDSQIHWSLDMLQRRWKTPMHGGGERPGTSRGPLRDFLIEHGCFFFRREPQISCFPYLFSKWPFQRLLRCPVAIDFAILRQWLRMVDQGLVTIVMGNPANDDIMVQLFNDPRRWWSEHIFYWEDFQSAHQPLPGCRCASCWSDWTWTRRFHRRRSQESSAGRREGPQHG